VAGGRAADFGPVLSEVLRQLPDALAAGDLHELARSAGAEAEIVLIGDLGEVEFSSSDG